MIRLAFTGDANRPGKRDYTGAFRPEARAYAGAVFPISLTAPRAHQREEIERLIVESRALAEVAFFCHGYRLRIELGYDIATVGSLARALAEVGCSRVALHACSTGAHATKGFAAKLRDAMIEAGLPDARVLGSTTAGHASMNPHRRLFVGPVGSPGEWIVEPRSARWKAWCRRMRAPMDSLRFELLDPAIHTEIAVL